MLGLLAKAYRNTGTEEAPTWTEIPQFETVALDGGGYDFTDDNTRESPAKGHAPTLLSIDATGRLKVKPTNANYIALMDAFQSKTPLDMMFLSAAHDVEGARGVRAYYYVNRTNQDQGLTVVLYEDLQFMRDSDNKCWFVKVVAGVPTYTEITT